MEISGINNNASALLQTRLNETKSEASFQAALDSAMESKDKEQLKKACVEFESYFIQLAFKEMRKSVDSSGGIFPKSQTEEVFQEMLDEEFAKEAANGRGIGLANMMYQQMEANL